MATDDDHYYYRHHNHYYYYYYYYYYYHDPPQVCIKKPLKPSLAKMASSGFVSIHYMYFGLILVAVTTIMAIGVSHLTPPPTPEQLENTTFWAVNKRTRAKKKEEEGDDDRKKEEEKDEHERLSYCG